MAMKIEPSIYRELYLDLACMTDDELCEHWENHGQHENRIGSTEIYCQKNNIPFSQAIYDTFDVDFYISHYKDLESSPLKTKLDFSVHFVEFGFAEGRHANIVEMLNSNETPHYFNSIQESYLSYIKNINQNHGLYSSEEEVLLAITGQGNKKIHIYNNAALNAKHYYGLGDFFKSNFSMLESRTNFRLSFAFDSNNSAIEKIGHIYFDEGNYHQALSIYLQLIAEMHSSDLMLLRTLEAQTHLRLYSDGLKCAVEFLKKQPSATFLLGAIESLSEQFFKELEQTSAIYAVKDREKLEQQFQDVTQHIYQTYFQFFGAGKQLKGSINTEKILIIADHFIPQCVRYRIEQKKAQLEKQGKQVTVVDWINLKEHENTIALHDIVIFYRVPVNAEILKAIALTNASGKASFYEIDDYLFGEGYPGTIEDFGGYVDINTYIDLSIGSVRLKVAAQYCKFGIASTQLLCNKLELLVSEKKCLLHRNGLDHLNVIKKIKGGDKQTIDIFYGSGTQAHNQDFIDQALPALKQILTKHKQARLIIAGYLKLPSEIISSFSEQIVLLPKVNSVQAYWGLLERADINLAVLNDNEINGCKSELKWFEAACFGIPSILSTTDNYRDVIEHGKDAFLAANQEDWLSSLDVLVSQSELRVKIGSTAQNRVKGEYSLETLGKSLSCKLEQLFASEAVVTKIKKKIALVNVFFPPQAIGGATRVLSDNFDVLQKQYGDDFELVIFTSDDRCTTPYELVAYQHQGVTVYRSTVLYRENMDWHPKDPEMYTLFEQFLELEKPDVVHFHCVQRLTASVIEATKDKAIPYVITAHDAWWISDHQFLVDDDGNVYPDGHPDIFKARSLPNNVTFGDSLERLMYTKELLNGASCLLTVSESFADIYRKNGYPEIQVNKNGISSSVEWLPKETTYSDKVVCGHIGGMANHKGYFLLKEAIEKLQPKNIEMLIVDHSKDEGYEKKATWGSVPVTFIGRANQSKVTELYQKLDVLFAPSMWPESYGLVTREAAACGCWVVASDLGGIGEDVIEGQTGLRVKPNLESVSNAVQDLDRNANKFKQRIEQSDIRIVDKQVEELVEIYNVKY